MLKIIEDMFDITLQSDRPLSGISDGVTYIREMTIHKDVLAQMLDGISKGERVEINDGFFINYFVPESSCQAKAFLAPCFGTEIGPAFIQVLKIEEGDQTQVLKIEEGDQTLVFEMTQDELDVVESVIQGINQIT